MLASFFRIVQAKKRNKLFGALEEGAEKSIESEYSMMPYTFSAKLCYSSVALT